MSLVLDIKRIVVPTNVQHEMTNVFKCLSVEKVSVYTWPSTTQKAKLCICKVVYVGKLRDFGNDICFPKNLLGLTSLRYVKVWDEKMVGGMSWQTKSDNRWTFCEIAHVWMLWSTWVLVETFLSKLSEWSGI